jgi:deoxycytidylate deaminase|uniref:Nucleoside deaminase n=1 Tax=Siphoviridae sp. ctnPP24 TaxID=2825662 RepID=A0A8S5TYL6_9CAUD|nr:MAG TPA: nucleoside deaminase [Siphoviridae sp. ctnPP24]DAG95825.1 MAG TPA: nucleoside deaminase [Herelleviridae sp.]
MAEFSKHDMKMFDLARKAALESTYEPFKLGAVISYKGRVLATGHNSRKTNPLQKKYNRKYRTFRYNGKPIHDYLHAEMDCLLNIPKCIDININYSKANIYIYRISPGKPLLMGRSFPCAACLNALRDKGIRHIYYTDDNGLAFQELY